MKGDINIFITGMYQTGVESVADFLRQIGGLVPELWQAEIQDVNTALLKAYNCFWDQLDIVKLSQQTAFHIPRYYSQRIDTLLNNNSHGARLFVDPMFCLTSQHWDVAGRDSLFVVCVRNPLHTAYALEKEYGFSLYKGLCLWECYYWALLRSVDISRCIFVESERLLTGQNDYRREFCQKLAKHGLQVVESAAEIADFSLIELAHQQDLSEEELQKVLSADQMALWQKIQTLVGSYHLSQYPSFIQPILQKISLLKNPRELIGVIRDSRLLSSSKAYFDSDYYLRHNRDIAVSAMDPLFHFLTRGWRECRNPSPYFNIRYYLENNPDIEKAGINPLIHYIKNGWKENRKPNAGMSIEELYALKQQLLDRSVQYLELYQREGNVPQSPSAMPLRIDFIEHEDTFKRKVTVVVPVYLADAESIRVFLLLLESLVKSYPVEREFLKFVFIDDCSPEREMQSCLQETGFINRQDVILHENEINRGFVKTVNIGFQLSGTDTDVVILNSDTEVHGHVFESLQHLCLRYNDIASVTPLSNRAGLNCISFWPIGDDTVYDIEPEKIASLVELTGIESPNDYLPTGHGFCMYMSSEALASVGHFDEETFAKGYGEENDWCLRAIQKGFRHLASTECYVHHHESKSFSGEQKQAYQTQNGAKLSALYPYYDYWVQCYLNRNPLEVHRKFLQIMLLEEIKKKGD